jgi:hypothetical protein
MSSSFFPSQWTMVSCLATNCIKQPLGTEIDLPRLMAVVPRSGSQAEQRRGEASQHLRHLHMAGVSLVAAPWLWQRIFQSCDWLKAIWSRMLPEAPTPLSSGYDPGPFTPGVEKRRNSDPFQAGKRKSAGLFFWRFCADCVAKVVWRRL